MIDVSRPGPFGNIFKIGRDGNRAQVVEKHRIWLLRPEQVNLRAKIRKELQGKPLEELYCSGCRGTQPCHNYNLWTVANAN